MASESLKPSVVIVGPTASGKTELGLELARRLNGEIISADSRQIYRLLDAGTAKPTGHWVEDSDGRSTFIAKDIPYHLVDILDPSERIDAARFAALASPLIKSIQDRGRRVILVGGTGLYLRALLDGLDPLPPRNNEIRERLAELAEINGKHWLHEELARIDPEAAKRIPPNNLHRVVRALEVHELTGRPISSQWTRVASGAHSSAELSSRDGDGQEGNAGGSPIYLGILWERAALQMRIDERCKEMFPNLIEEVKRLVPAKFTGREPGFQSLGYPQALRCAAGEMTQDQALASMSRDTIDYAKRQATWFRRQVPAHWIDAGEGNVARWADEALRFLEQ